MNSVSPPLSTSRSVAVVAAALGLFCACGLGPSQPHVPPPELVSLSAYKLDFTAALNHTSEPQSFSITNMSGISVSLNPQSKWLPANPKNPYKLNTDCGSYLGPGASCTVTVSYHPMEGSWDLQDLKIQATDEMHSVHLFGNVQY